MKRIVHVSVLLLLFLFGCSSEFDKSMKLGREALKEGNYVTAVNHFENAVIENPSDDDARILLQMAKDGYTKSTFVVRFEEYVLEMQPVISKYIDVMTYQGSSKTKEDVEYLKNIITDAEVVGVKYLKDIEINNAHKLLEESMNSLLNGLTRSVELRGTLINREKSETLTSAEEFLLNSIPGLMEESGSFLEEYIKELNKVKSKYNLNVDSLTLAP